MEAPVGQTRTQAPQVNSPITLPPVAGQPVTEQRVPDYMKAPVAKENPRGPYQLAPVAPAAIPEFNTWATMQSNQPNMANYGTPEQIAAQQQKDAAAYHAYIQGLNDTHIANTQGSSQTVGIAGLTQGRAIDQTVANNPQTNNVATVVSQHPQFPNNMSTQFTQAIPDYATQQALAQPAIDAENARVAQIIATQQGGISQLVTNPNGTKPPAPLTNLVVR